MSIAFKDFAPPPVNQGGFFSNPEFAPFSVAVEEANRWIAENNPDIINVETVVLPEIWNRNEEGTEDGMLRAGGESSTWWHQFVRVWYRVG
jgi:hypothetical protein